MSRWFTSDLHFGHSNIIRYYGRPYSDLDTMSAAVLEAVNPHPGGGSMVAARSVTSGQTVSLPTSPGPFSPRPSVRRLISPTDTFSAPPGEISTMTTTLISARTVPALAAAIVCTNQFERDLVAACGVRVGAAVEVDLARLTGADTALANRLGDYWARCNELWDRFADGEVGLDAVDVRRLLRSAAQTDSRKGRLDLNAEMKALIGLSVVGPLVKELLGSEPDFASISARGASVGLSIEAQGDMHVVRFALPARRPWTSELGGVASRGEWERGFTMRVSHAPWRDRRVRRFVSLQVHATETWARP